MRFQLGRRYLWQTPYSIVRREGEATGRPQEELIWGETPCVTLVSMLVRAHAVPGEVFCDLGCGRGMTVLAAHLVAGLKARGYEIVPTFVAKARAVSESLGLTGVAWIEGSLLEADLGDCDIAMVSWTTFSPEVRRQVAEKLETMRPGSRVLTLTYPLAGTRWKQTSKDSLRFSWGWGTVYCYELSE